MTTAVKVITDEEAMRGLTPTQWIAFERVCKENGLTRSNEYGSTYLNAKYWFMLGWDAREELAPMTG